MANVIVLGAEVNWWRAQPARLRRATCAQARLASQRRGARCAAQARGASARASTRRRARRPSASRRAGRRPGRSRSPFAARLARDRAVEDAVPRPRAVRATAARARRPMRARRSSALDCGERHLRVPALGAHRAVCRPGPPPSAAHLDPRVVAEHPAVGWPDEPAERALTARSRRRFAVLRPGTRPRRAARGSQSGNSAELLELVRVAASRRCRARCPLSRVERRLPPAGRTAAPRCPAAARSSSSSSRARSNGTFSAVACTSTRSPSPVMTTFTSTSAFESSE